MRCTAAVSASPSIIPRYTSAAHCTASTTLGNSISIEAIAAAAHPFEALQRAHLKIAHFIVPIADRKIGSADSDGGRSLLGEPQSVRYGVEGRLE
jgi:hypothetical protein